MKAKNKVFIILISTLSLTAIASFSYLFVSHAINNETNNIEVISFSSLDTPLAYSYSFGTISPGNSVSQSFRLSSSIVMDVTYTVSFSHEEDSDIFSYLYVSTNFDDEKISLSSIFDYDYLSRTLKSNDSEDITITYLLDERTPESVFGDCSFSVLFNARI